MDVGTSGGVWGLERGYCMMIGGEPATVKHLDPLFVTLAPGIGGISRTPVGKAPAVVPPSRAIPLRAEWRRALRQDGAQRHRARPHGGSAEGMGILKAANIGKQTHAVDAETTRFATRLTTSMTSISARSPRCGAAAVASWLLDLGDFAAGGSVAVEVRRPRVRLGRGALDDHGGDRRGGAGAGAHRLRG